MRVAKEIGKATLAVYAEDDKLGLHRLKTDEAYRIGEGMGPVAVYLSIEEIIRAAKGSGTDVIKKRMDTHGQSAPRCTDKAASTGSTLPSRCLIAAEYPSDPKPAITPVATPDT